MERIEQSYKEFLYHRSGIIGSAAKQGLSALSCLYSLAIRLRLQAYRHNILASFKNPNTFTISIGNLQAGGTGKTPFTLFLAEQLAAAAPAAILTRGYRSRLNGNAPALINDALGVKFSPGVCGDEPYMLARRMPDMPVFVGKNRCASSKQASQNGVKIILLDDGFQHLRIRRDIDIVLIDASLPEEAEHLLPRGLLREPLQSLSRASLVVLTKLENHGAFDYYKNKLEKYTGAPIIAADLNVANICVSHATVNDKLAASKGALFCGIANPHSFVKTAQSLGLQLLSHDFYADHARYTQGQIRQLAQNALDRGASYLFCTEKDIVKIEPWFDSLPLPVAWPRMTISISKGKCLWDNFLNDLKEKITACD